MKKNLGGEKCAVIKNKSQGSAFRFLNSDVIEQGLNLPSSNARTRNEKGEISGPFSKILGNSMRMPGDLAAAGAACWVSMEGEGLLPGPTADPLSQKVGLEQPTPPTMGRDPAQCFYRQLPFRPTSHFWSGVSNGDHFSSTSIFRFPPT